MPGQLMPLWRYALFGLWVLIAGAFFAIAFTAELNGKPPWWSAGVATVVPFGICVTAALTAWINHRWSRIVGILCALALGGVAWGDVENAPGAAVASGILAAAALLATLATLTGRIRPPHNTVTPPEPS
jgi:uncharacterized membrane protein